MKNIFNLVRIMVAVLMGVFVIAPIQGVLAADQPQTRDFLRARIMPGIVTARIDGEAVMELTTDGDNATVPVKLVNGQPVTGEVQIPFIQGTYSIRLVKGGTDVEQDLLRVRGVLTSKGPGVYEHTATETMADPSALAFGQDGPAVTIEAGSIQGSVVVMLLTSGQEQLSVSVSLDSNGDGAITEQDIKKQATVQGPQATVELPSAQGLPLTSIIQVEVRDSSNATPVARIEGPYDLVTGGRASAQPLQELKQDKVKSVLVILKKVPWLTKIEIPAARLAPPPETVKVQPQSVAQNALAAFGDTEGLKLLFQGVEASVTLTSDAGPAPDKANPENTNNSAKRTGLLEMVASAFNRLKDSVGIPVVVILGVILVGGLFTLIMWSAFSRQARAF